MKISKKLFLVSLLPLLILAFGSITGAVVVWRMHDSINSYMSKVDSKLTLISSIYYELGYGNGIHSFKNYILRRQEQYKINAKEELTKTNDLIDQYLGMKDLSLVEHQTLHLLRDTVKLYIANLDIASKMIFARRSIAAVDIAVKVDDNPAVASLKELQTYLAMERAKGLEKIERVNKASILSIAAMFVFTTIFSLVFSQKISHRLVRSIEQLKKLSIRIKEGVLHEKHEDKLEISEDEFRLLADQMLDMKKALNATFERLKKKNKELEQFSFMSAHDLKTPLKNIFSYSDLLNESLEDGDKESSKLYCSEIRNNTDKMMDYVSDLLSLTRLGAEALQISEVNVKDVIEELKKSFRKNNKKVEILYAEVPEAIFVDRIKFYRLLQNLLENSIKYSKDSVRIEIKGAQSESGEWAFSVADNGSGIRARDFEKIFLPFRRATTEHEGTGVGLAIVKKIVELHGGEIWVESEINAYTKFFFTIKNFEGTRLGEGVNDAIAA